VQALPRPTVYIWARFMAAPPCPASAARLYQPAAAGQSGAATPSPESKWHPRQNSALGSPASAALVYHSVACSCSFLWVCVCPNQNIACACPCPAASFRSAMPSSSQGLHPQRFHQMVVRRRTTQLGILVVRPKCADCQPYLNLWRAAGRARKARPTCARYCIHHPTALAELGFHVALDGLLLHDLGSERSQQRRGAGPGIYSSPRHSLHCQPSLIS